MNRLRILVSMTLMLGMCISMYANPDVTGKKKDKNGDVGTTITLVTSGTGNTKEEATKNALRSALEQTYGAFVSANSQVVNDELVKDEIISICREYNIDITKNKNAIKHISVQELESKIEFLKDNNIPIVDSNGVLIDIFTMSSTDMKEKYNVTLEELINEYYINKQKGKGV